MKKLRSVGSQLLAALVLVPALAFVIVYMLVVPSLGRHLVNVRLDQLATAAPRIAARFPRSNPLRQFTYVSDAATAANARVAVVRVLLPAPRPEVLIPITDSGTSGGGEILTDPLVPKAVLSRRVERGTLVRGGIRRAEVALRFGGDLVLVLSSPLEDTGESVSEVKKRLLIAAVPTLLVALTIAALGARTLIRRIQRLQQAAERISAGSFSESLADRRRDELGELARSFERMRRRLASLDEERRAFIANASHELRTPIFALSGSIELLTEEEMDEESRRDFLETMRVQVQRLSKLATDLLDLSRLDAGRLELAEEAVSLGAAAATIAGEFAAVAELRGQLLGVRPGDDAMVLADEERLLQSGGILVENALVHTPPGTRVRIAVEGGEHPALVVEDDGPGIPAEHRERIFERFYRAGGERAAGGGLGLAIGRELCQLMGGTLTIESQPGWTRFVIRLRPARGGIAPRTGVPGAGAGRGFHVETAPDATGPARGDVE
ncbi:MAG: sensor histidine kinase [Gaiellaceae bacterium]